MNNKIHFKRFLRIISCVLIVVLVVSGAGLFCNHPNLLIEGTINSFYNEENDSLDYLLIGASAALNDASPTVIWQKSKLAGNNFSVNGCHSDIYVSMLKESLSKQKNALLVIDVDPFYYDISQGDTYGATSSWIDLMPKNKNWLETIKKCDSQNTIEHFFPILKYHCYSTKAYTFLSQTKKSLTNKQPDSLKGWNILNDFQIEQSQINSLKLFDSNALSPTALEKELETNLYETLDYCKDNNLNVVFVDYPKSYFNDEKKQIISKTESKLITCENIIRQYGYDVLNYNKLDNPAALTKNDFADCYHLNKKGAVKFSTFLADYLAENYTFKSHTAQFTDSWDKTAREVCKTYNL